MKKTLYLLLLYLCGYTVSAKDLSTVNFGTATVDGDISEWTEEDFFISMYNGFNNNKKNQVLTKLYLKYGEDGTLYVMVKTINTQRDVLVAGDDAFVKIGNDTKILDGKKVGEYFQWIDPKKVGGKNLSFGYEGKVDNFFNFFFPGIELNVHVNVDGVSSLINDNSRLTSGLEGKAVGLLLPKPDPKNPNESIPIDGGLSLLLTVGIGYGAYKRRNKE